ncbi:MAG TPA: MazG-like family protein [Chloroflexota bacterium]
MPDSDMTLLALRRRIRAFVQAREWESFHNPKDLAAAIAIEAAELMELFLWKDPQEVDQAVGQQESRGRIEEELADIVILCLSLANRLEIDVADAVTAKVASNEVRYPTELARGKAHKYTHYEIDP